MSRRSRSSTHSAPRWRWDSWRSKETGWPGPAGLVCVVDPLTYLERGGRIGKARALLGSLLNVKPILQLKDGEVVPIGRARGRPQALSRLVELLERDGKVSQLAIMHGAAPADAEQLRERVAASYPGLDILLTEIGAVLGTHTGPGVIGVTYLLAAPRRGCTWCGTRPWTIPSPSSPVSAIRPRPGWHDSASQPPATSYCFSRVAMTIFPALRRSRSCGPG